MDNRWLSVEKIGVHLGVKRDTGYKWILRNGMPAHRAGRLWKFRMREVDQWVESGKAASRASGQRARK